MGMYTELHFNAELKKDTPQAVIEILKFMIGEIDEQPPVPYHSLFEKTQRWPWMLRSDSYYFDADTHSTLRYDNQESYYLCIRCNLKNYDDEIEKFIDWVMPYLDKDEGEFLGFSRYEETQHPTLIFMK